MNYTHESLDLLCTQGKYETPKALHGHIVVTEAGLLSPYDVTGKAPLSEIIVKPEISVRDSKGSELVITTDYAGKDNTISTQVKYTIAGTPIREQDGLFNLTDVWRASNTPAQYKPNEWLRNDNTRVFFSVISKFYQDSTVATNSKDGISPLWTGGDIPGHLMIRQGRYGGTWASELPMLKYAAWIGPHFEIMVYDVYRNSTISVQSDLDMMLDPNVEDVAKFQYAQTLNSPNEYNTINEYAILLSTYTERDITYNRLYNVLRKLKYLKTGRGVSEKNKPYQHYVTNGYFAGVNTVVGPNMTVTVALISPKGIAELSSTILDKYKEIYDK